MHEKIQLAMANEMDPSSLGATFRIGIANLGKHPLYPVILQESVTQQETNAADKEPCCQRTLICNLFQGVHLYNWIVKQMNFYRESLYIKVDATAPICT